MDEPNTFRLIWRAGVYRVDKPNIDTCEVVRTDDPAIQRAIRIAAWAEENNLLGPDREPRKILGTLPVTADGCVVLPGAKVWPRADLYIYNDPVFNAEWTPDEESAEVEFHLAGDIEEWDVDKCYSSHEAAERAAKGGGDEH